MREQSTEISLHPIARLRERDSHFELGEGKCAQPRWNLGVGRPCTMNEIFARIG